MSRANVLYQIDQLIAGKCGSCEKRAEMNRTFGSRFAQIDSYCNKHCNVGQQLQALGRELIKKKPRAIDARGKTLQRTSSL